MAVAHLDIFDKVDILLIRILPIVVHREKVVGDVPIVLIEVPIRIVLTVLEGNEVVNSTDDRESSTLRLEEAVILVTCKVPQKIVGVQEVPGITMISVSINETIKEGNLFVMSSKTVFDLNTVLFINIV